MARATDSGAAWVLACGETSGSGAENGTAPAGAFDHNCLVQPMIVAAAMRYIDIRLPCVPLCVLGLDVLVEERGPLLLRLGSQDSKRGGSQARTGVEHGEAILEVIRLGLLGVSGGRRFRRPRNQAAKKNPEAPDGPDLRGLGCLRGTLCGGERFRTIRSPRRFLLLIAAVLLGRAGRGVGFSFFAVHVVRLHRRTPGFNHAAWTCQGRPLPARTRWCLSRQGPDLPPERRPPSCRLPRRSASSRSWTLA